MSRAEGFAIVVVLGALAGTACAPNRAVPKGALPTPEEAETDAFGGWIEFIGGSHPDGVAGELIAVTEDTAWVLDASADRVVAVATDGITAGRFIAYDGQHERIGGASVLGTLSTLSNGAGLIFTAPMWIIGGTIAAAHQSRVPIQRLPAASWTDLAPFARFPQGLPPGLDLDSLRPRPAPVPDGP